MSETATPPEIKPSVKDRLIIFYKSTSWWAIILAAILLYALFTVVTSEEHRDILDAMLDRPEWTTDDKFDVVYSVNRPVTIVQQDLLVKLPDGSRQSISVADVTTREEGGTLICDKEADPECLDERGEIVTFAGEEGEQTGLIVREDYLIRFEDGFEDTVRGNRLEDISTEGDTVTATYEDRVIGTEIGKVDDQIRVRTVDEQTIFVPADRIISTAEGTVECDTDASPRCQDYEGTIIERRGAVTSGELTIENARAVNIIPDGASDSVEIRKSNIVEEERTPANCEVADEGACMIEVIEEDDVVAGLVIDDDNGDLTLQTVAPVFVDLDPDAAEAIRRAPLTCALNNIRGCNAGVWLTMIVTLTAYGIALAIGLAVGLMRVSSNPILYHVGTLYVEIIRGTPLLVLLLFFAFVIGPLIRDSGIGPLTVFYDGLNRAEVAVLGEESFLGEAVLGLAIGYGAFLAEVIRAGIESINKGQMEAARSLGMSYTQAMRKIILPQAIRVVLPPLGNDFIAMLKDSALISVLALPDLLQEGRLYITRTFQPIPVYVTVALLYVIMTLVLSGMVRFIERRFKLP